jgi:hypothetical protein
MGMFGKRGGRSATPAGMASLFGIALGIGILYAAPARGQYLAQSRSVVDTPTAGLLARGSFETRSRVFPGGGVDFRLELGLANWLSLGTAYGGVQIIGDGEPDWNPEPGFFLKARVLDETWVGPALAVGIDTQGSGYYDHDRNRFQFKSRGLYAVASKNYAWYGDFSLHGGISRSFEDDDDGEPTAFVALEKSLGAYFGVAAEYDVATNDNRDDGTFGQGRGYLNGAVHWSLAPEIQLRLVIRDMLNNSEPVEPRLSDVVVDEGWGRELSFSYVESF